MGLIALETFITASLRRLLRARNELIRRAAEGDDWRRYLDPSAR